MQPGAIAEAEPQPAGMGEFSRIPGVFFEPKKTFEDIARRPTFIVPMVLVILFSLAFTISISQKIGWERVVTQQMAQNPQTAQMPPEQRQQAINMGSKIAGIIAYVGPILGVPLYCLIAAAVLLGIASGIMSAGLKFKQVFAIVAWSGMPGLISALLGIVVMYMKNPDDFNMNNPIAFNVGAFMDPQGSKFAYSLASSIDLFSFWTIFLIATGLKAAAGKKLSFGGALFAVVLPWAIVILAKSA
ncbi:MAG TPA: Yip1 family protein, partial [Bryobacteraceae bacterium]